MKRSWNRRARIDLVPLIDVLVNLLFFFLMFGVLDDGSASLPIRMAGSKTAPAAEAPRLVVSLDLQGRYSVGREEAEAGEVPSLIAHELAENPNLQVVLYPDREVAYNQVVAALDLLRKGGVERPALGVARDGAPDDER